MDSLVTDEGGGGEGVHTLSCFFFAFQVFGYVVISTLLEFFFYHHQRAHVQAWKTQRTKASASRNEKWVWGLPALDLIHRGRQQRERPLRHPMHAYYATANLLVSGLFAGAVCEATLRGLTTLSHGSFKMLPLIYACTWQCVAEYYWHRLMHWPAIYKRLHKLHHHYKAPEPFDDLFIHPLEAIGYYCILFSPVVLVSDFPIVSFFAYMTVMGLCGVCDHSGVSLRVPWIYNAADHDIHHELFHYNFAFPVVAMDILHGTYRPASTKLANFNDENAAEGVKRTLNRKPE